MTLEARAVEAEAVRYQSFTARIDTSGRFELPGVRPGQYRAWVRGKGLSSKPGGSSKVESLGITQATFEIAGWSPRCASGTRGAGSWTRRPSS